MCYVGNGAHFTLLCVFRSYLVTVLVSIGTVVHARCRSRARRWRTVSRVSCVSCRCLVTASAHSICWSVSYHFDIVARIVVAVGGRRPSRSPLLSSIYDEHAIHYYRLGIPRGPDSDRNSEMAHVPSCGLRVRTADCGQGLRGRGTCAISELGPSADCECGLQTADRVSENLPRRDTRGPNSEMGRWRMSPTQRLLPQSAVRSRSLHSYASCSGSRRPIRSPESAFAVRTPS